MPDAPSTSAASARSTNGRISAEHAIEIFLERRRSGELVDPRAFAAEHPDLEPDLSSALAALLALERATPPEPTLDPATGAPLPERVGDYRVVREIGHGGMGVVFEAIEERLNRRVALKVLPPELLASASARSRFRREAELAARLDHSGIATVYGAGMEDERPWIAMRYVEGATLARSIQEARDDGARELRLGARGSARDATLAVASLIAKIARALHSAHELGVVHRDIKPSNVIVQPDGSPVLLDFGLAIAEESDGRSLTRTGDAPGTPAYLAPETVSGELARPDAQSDVYALGVMLYECLTLRRPFEAPTRIALYRAILSGTPDDPRALNRSVSRDLAVVTAAAMERERARRYRSALALAEDLEACVGGHAIAARPVPWHGRVARWIRREPRQAALAGSLGAAAIALTLFGGKYWASREIVRAAEKVANDNEREHALSRGYLAIQSDFGAAESAFTRALELDPGSLEAVAGRVLVRIRYRRVHEAQALLERAPKTPGFDAMRDAVARSPVVEDASLASVAQASALDFFLVGVALELDSDRESISRRAAVSTRAVAMLNEAVVCAPSPRSFMHVERAIAAAEAGDERTARSSARALLALWPDSYDEVFAAGRALADFDPQAARPIFEHATRIDPREPGALQALGVVCLHLRALDEAESWFWRALALSSDVETYNALGIAYTMRGCYSDAIASYERAARDPRKADLSLLNLARLRLGTDDPAAAIAPLLRAIELDASDADAHDALGMSYFRLGDLERARQHLEHAIGLDPGVGERYATLADLLSMMGEDDAAEDAVAAGLALQPGNEVLIELRDRIESHR